MLERQPRPRPHPNGAAGCCAVAHDFEQFEALSSSESMEIEASNGSSSKGQRSELARLADRDHGRRVAVRSERLEGSQLRPAHRWGVAFLDDAPPFRHRCRRTPNKAGIAFQHPRSLCLDAEPFALITVNRVDSRDLFQSLGQLLR